ncbi:MULTISPECIES: hypothetical protein [Nocardiaceae]|uniref:Uncharacterized protein n=1 Tax=Rhodococcoides corynebacterioides TaxID=53972 RepID=A0ABS2KX01_9NOCA|nr:MULTISPECIES: hypothetical protein [Rhodococcus]MBM7416331.1 hypothetical protein [Rhodococcus corynebacterioides]MBP1114584.1 hypothetical protein [Rhodococcus sp. PvP016]
MNATVLAVLCAVGRLGPITTLVREPLWWIGTVVGMGGYGLQAAALGPAENVEPAHPAPNP